MITQQLTSFNNTSEAKNYKVISPFEGVPVAAYYKEDQSWHRAQVVKVIPEDLTAEIVSFFI